MIIVGIDPANEGALVVLEGTNVPIVVLWKKVQRKKKKVFQVSISRQDSSIVKQVICRTAAHIGNVIANLPELSIVNGIAIEDCYLARNAKTTITLARFAGSVSAPLVVKSGFDPAYVKPTEWRKVVLNQSKKIKREQAKMVSLKYIPIMIPAIESHLSKLGKFDHITDALGIALWLAKKNKQ